jgi:hypothetical protein
MTLNPFAQFAPFDLTGLTPADVWILDRRLSRVYYVRGVTKIIPVFREFREGWWRAPEEERREREER